MLSRLAGLFLLVSCSGPRLIRSSDLGTPAETLVSAKLATVPSLNTNAQAQVSVDSEIVGAVTPDFVGFSYEKSILSSPLFDASNATLIALFSKWGPGVLRVGGNSANETVWNPSGAGAKAGETAPSDVDRLGRFLGATGWRVIYGLNATTSSPELSASEAAYVAGALGDALDDFEIGNEPDLYASNGLKPTTYTFASFLTDWDNYAAAIKEVVPQALFSGPASAWNETAYTVPFAQQRGSEIELLTQHYYRANGKLASSTIDFLLTPDPKLPGDLSALSSAADAGGIGYRLAETNSYYNGGAQGVSDGFGSALWLIEYCFALAENGAVGANFHGGGNSDGYTPIANDAHGNVVEARAEYYGMLLFSLMGSGDVLRTSASGTSSALFTGAVGSEGSLFIVLANNSRTDVVAATVALPAAYVSATALLLTAPSLDATTDMTLGGSAVGDDGSWAPTTLYSVSLSGSTLSIDVPAASSYLLQIY